MIPEESFARWDEFVAATRYAEDAGDLPTDTETDRLKREAAMFAAATRMEAATTALLNRTAARTA